ncbi:uncharacterized protein LOC100304031 [Zea mays]|uniref:Uncharacterized protein n=1 Tax=Zea mays TaxID=4577 RepID=B6TNY4_MAIZE|nr:uncharacterized protein LOC100304031 [Zea mays]ACG38817.1 hypothetical protein [Zea mays]ACG44100.1 hypothetical protein [Zea mays]ACG44780.1 hypothetical protein [Zea mays]
MGGASTGLSSCENHAHPTPRTRKTLDAGEIVCRSIKVRRGTRTPAGSTRLCVTLDEQVTEDPGVQ